MQQEFQTILAGLATGTVVPYLGPGALAGVVERGSGRPIPADSESLILALNNGQPMAPKLMYEFPRAAMHVELKKGRSTLVKFLDRTYRDTDWTASPLHDWLARLDLPQVIDANRDTLLQRAWADRPHTLVTGVARIAGTAWRFKLYESSAGKYRPIPPEEAKPDLPVLFKPVGTPLPESNYIASDADFVDYITELMGGFAIPEFIKQRRPGKQYLLLGLRLTRDTERMLLSDLTYGHGGGWALIPEPTAKERRFLDRIGFQCLECGTEDLLAAAGVSASGLARAA